MVEKEVLEEEVMGRMSRWGGGGGGNSNGISSFLNYLFYKRPISRYLKPRNSCTLNYVKTTVGTMNAMLGFRELIT